MNISKSITIDQPIDKVYGIISDFHQWTAWSPWLIMEPEAKVTVADDGKSYAWNGKRVGEGNMKVLSESSPSRIDYDLVFLKPWKSKASVSFHLASEGNGTKATWTMGSSLPFFMFFMKKMMEAFVGMDYERGLLMLKDYAEGGSVPSKLEFAGKSNAPETKYIGIRTACARGDMEQKMTADFDKLWGFLQDKGDLIQGNGLSIYHKWDMVKGQVEYTAGVQVNAHPSDLPDGVFAAAIPATPVHTVRHVGSYRHLGNAWSTQYNMMRAKAFKPNKKLHPFEMYGNKPGEVDEKELITDVHFATR
ncbi:MAG: SRPBCC family protein [Bacteroidota bacterium]